MKKITAATGFVIAIYALTIAQYLAKESPLGSTLISYAAGVASALLSLWVCRRLLWPGRR